MTIACLLVLLLPWVCPVDPYRTSQERRREAASSWDYLVPQEYHEEVRNRELRECRRCCDPGEETPHQFSSQRYPQYQIVPQINLTLLKGDKGDAGDRGPYGKPGRVGEMGPPGSTGMKGSKGSMGLPGGPQECCASANEDPK
ncbi:complement C1q tumor necrosis factor-related protein 1 isoform 2-T2 [Aulostomus maculatus]